MKKKKRGMHWLEAYTMLERKKWDLVIDLRNSLLSRLIRKRQIIRYNESSDKIHKVESYCKLIGLKKSISPFIPKNNTNKKIINVAVASHTPIQRGLESIQPKFRNRFIMVGQEYDKADYIFKNNISEVNSYLIKKYQIPKNFNKIYELKIDNVIIYEIFKKFEIKK